MPFQSDSAAKLEELILEGELKFTELEWINTSQGGERRCTHTPVALQGCHTVTVHNYPLKGAWAKVENFESLVAPVINTALHGTSSRILYAYHMYCHVVKARLLGAFTEAREFKVL